MCKYCKVFNEEKEKMEIAQLCIDGSYYDYDCPINYCPNCGKKLIVKVSKNK